MGRRTTPHRGGKGGERVTIGIEEIKRHFDWIARVSHDTTLHRCHECSATVDEYGLKEHLEWHEKLRSAVDETGTLT
jgi:hypothetical protein